MSAFLLFGDVHIFHIFSPYWIGHPQVQCFDAPSRDRVLIGNRWHSQTSWRV